MASGSPSRMDSGMEDSFSLVAGDFTDAEKEYLRRKGLIYENSNDETLDISTDVGSLNSSSVSRSNVDSLLIFEENEKLYANLVANYSSNTSRASPRSSGKSPEVQRFGKNKLRDSAFSPGFSRSLNEEEDDKENTFKGPMGIQRRLTFQDDDLDRVREPLEEIKGLSEPCNELETKFEKSPASTPRTSSPHLSEDDVCMVPCTQDVNDSIISNGGSDQVEVIPCTQAVNDSIGSKCASDDIDIIPCTQEVNVLESSSIDSEEVNVVPCTQAANVSVHNLNETYTSDILEESLAEEDEELVPCTQEPSMTNEPEDEEEEGLFDVSSIPCSQEQFDGSSVPCSQASQDASNLYSQLSGESTKDELNDTIAVMERLLKLADEQEEKEKQEFEANRAKEQESVLSPSANTQVQATPANDAMTEPEMPKEEETFFKTPLKHERVRLLKNKKVASPSPPRQYAKTLLEQRSTLKVLPKSQAEKKVAATSSSPLKTSTPNRAPVTPAAVPRKNHTPGRSGMLKTPVSAKVDSGLKGGFPIGLSPVAKYIYDKPAPSKFVRTHTTTVSSVVNSSASRIPLPPSASRGSLIPTKKATQTPCSASKEPKHSVLRTSTYFNLTATPPQIVANEKNMSEKKQFKPMQYNGPSKVKTLSGKVESPRENDFVAHRHTGLRDESGNASFIQNTMVQKRTIPQSRLATPKSYIKNNKF